MTDRLALQCNQGERTKFSPVEEASANCAGPSPTPRKAREVPAIQALRAVAAIAVAACHFDQVSAMLSGHGNEPFALYPLAAGVDLFFIISGFVMVYSSEHLFGTKRGPKAFIIRRIARIAPVYWLTTAIAIPLMSLPFTLASLLASYFFIPYRAPNGTIVPLHGVGWTLNFEMFFYAVFAAAIFLPKRMAILGVLAALSALVAVGQFFSMRSTVLLYWSDPLVLEFAAGMLFALLYQRANTTLIVPIWLRVSLIAIAALWIASFAPSMVPSRLRVIEWGLPAAIIFFAVVIGHKRDMPKWIKGLGDASYSIYLIHPLMGAVVFIGWKQGLSRFPMAAVLATGFVLMIALSLIAYRSFERPISDISRRFFTGGVLPKPEYAYRRN